KLEKKTYHQVIGIGRPHKSDKIACTYDYCDADGNLLFQVVRMDPKDFRQRRPGASKGTWVWNLDGVDKVLYKLPDIVNRPQMPVWVTEGEKDVLTLNGILQVATTSPGGAGHWRNEYSQYLSNRDVILCGDNDKAGKEHMADVQQNVHTYAKS